MRGLGLFPLPIVLLAFLFSCNESQDAMRPLKSLDDAKLVVESLQRLNGKVLEFLDSHPNRPVTVYAIYVGGGAGLASVYGVDSIASTGDDCLDLRSQRTIGDLAFDKYTSHNFLTLSGHGEIVYRLTDHSQALCTQEPDTDPYNTKLEKYEIRSGSLLITSLELHDLIEIIVSHEKSNDSRMDPQQSESVHYYIKSSSGEIFEWDL